MAATTIEECATDISQEMARNFSAPCRCIRSMALPVIASQRPSAGSPELYRSKPNLIQTDHSLRLLRAIELIGGAPDSGRKRG